MLDRIIYGSFSLLFFLVPLFWSPLNFELFEFNKMILVYGLTVLIVGAWFLKIINSKTVILNRTPLDIPLLLFLGANILSTIFSIDQHTSIWGYYSRSNGGLLSIISYSLLYFAFVSNIKKEQIPKILKIGLFSGFIISLWGILEHFGVSPSCVILRSQFNANCWVQDVAARVFATLGQPNWMASYLGMLIFQSLYFLLTSRTKRQSITYYLLSITYYLAFTFTYSRGGTVGLLAGLGVFMSGYILCHPEAKGRKILRFFASLRMTKLPLLLGSFLFINLLFGSALTRFNLTQFFSKPQLPTTNYQLPTTTQLEVGGTESGQIRLIVWQGALEIFRHYPIFGSGVETFAYSYYQFRPLAHNLVSEWDFLYNKAHNEFLNYLANTGLVGFGTYMLVIGWFVVYSLLFTVRRKPYTINHLLLTSLLASYISYLVSNFFGFSVVITALFFYLFPAIAFVATDSVSTLHLPLSKIHFPPSIIYHHKLIIRTFQLAILLVTFCLLLVTFRIWFADTIFAKGEKAQEAGSSGEAYNYLTVASRLRPNEPFYRSELGVAAASSALALKDVDATLSAELKAEAQKSLEQVLTSNPKNTSFWRSAIRAYYDLSILDPDYNTKLLSAFDKAISLAPTDPKLLYNKAVVLGSLDRNDEAIGYLNKVVTLKPNYREGYLALGLFYFDQKKYVEAISSMRMVLKIVPNDPEALQALNDWGKQGVATDEANIQSNR